MLKQYTERFVPYVPVLLRVVLGIVFLGHGILKLQNPSGAIGFMEFVGIPLPTVAGWVITILESLGGLLLILGVGTRYLGVLFSIEMVVAILAHKVPNVGFIVSDAAGFELDIMLLSAALALIVLGSGPLSIEHNVLQREL